MLPFVSDVNFFWFGPAHLMVCLGAHRNLNYFKYLAKQTIFFFWSVTVKYIKEENWLNKYQNSKFLQKKRKRYKIQNLCFIKYI